MTPREIMMVDRATGEIAPYGRSRIDDGTIDEHDAATGIGSAAPQILCRGMDARLLGLGSGAPDLSFPVGVREDV
jgi:hypothetical protein